MRTNDQSKLEEYIKKAIRDKNRKAAIKANQTSSHGSNESMTTSETCAYHETEEKLEETMNTMNGSSHLYTSTSPRD